MPGNISEGRKKSKHFNYLVKNPDRVTEGLSSANLYDFPKSDFTVHLGPLLESRKTQRRKRTRPWQWSEAASRYAAVHPSIVTTNMHGLRIL